MQQTHISVDGTTLEVFVSVTDTDGMTHVDPDGWQADPNSANVVIVSQPAAIHVGTRIGVGNYRFAFSGLTAIADGANVAVKINGAIATVPWTEFVVWVRVSRHALRPSIAQQTLTLDGSGNVTLTAATILAIWNTLSAALVTAGSIGKRIVDFLTGDVFARVGAPAGASTSADIAAVKTVVDAHTTSLGTVVGNQISQGLVLGGISSDLNTVNTNVLDVSSALATVGTNVLTVNANVLTVNTNVNNVGIAVVAVGNAVSVVSAVTAKLDTALVLDGAVWQYTVNALENAPAGGGGGGGLTPEQQAQLDNIEDKCNLFEQPVGSYLLTVSGAFLCLRSDVELIYGVKNTAKWADIDNEGNATFITNRISTMIALADNMMRNALADGAYNMPEVGDTIPPQLVYHTAALAGVLLYESRGALEAEDGTSDHIYSFMKQSVQRFIADVNSMKIRLTLTAKTGSDTAPYTEA